MIGGARFGDQARATGAEFVAVDGAADYDDRRLDDHFPRRALAPAGVPRLDHDQRYLFGDAIAPQNAARQRLLHDRPDSVVLHDVCFLGAFPQLLGAPGVRPRRVVGVGVTPVALPGSELTAFGPPVPREGLDVRAAAAHSNNELEVAFEGATAYLNRALAETGATRSIPLMLRSMYGARGDRPAHAALVRVPPGRRPGLAAHGRPAAGSAG